MFGKGEAKFHDTGKLDPSTMGSGKVGGKGKAKSGPQKRNASSRSAQAGLHFPVGRIHRFLKGQCMQGQRCSIKAGVALASVTEYLCAELLELSGNCARDWHVKRIVPRHILIAIKSDEELNKFVTAWIPNSGTVPSTEAISNVKKATKKTNMDGN
eukprot:GAHX01000419.1.p1 GENE.GAHX01000419.1~~GAHX01000419.1.p1  ORF type:complete len:156 (+),score=18.16 GAHX01000419.1:42-509(+)